MVVHVFGKKNLKEEKESVRWNMADGCLPLLMLQQLLVPYRHRCSNPAEQPEDQAAQPPSSTSAKHQVTEECTPQLTQTPSG
jgi:hypothetical protein